MLVRVAIGALALATAGWGLWSALAERDEQTAGFRAVSVPAARQHELLKLNIDKPGDPDLMAMFDALNARHFGGALPPTPVRWEARLSEVGALASGAFTLEGMFGHIGKRTAILLNPDLRPNKPALDRALCHEVVHAYLFSLGESTETHGPPFQTVLRRLSDEGAFEGILADATEQLTLRGWLDDESARLDDEHDALKRLASEIERERSALERDVAELNARIARARSEGRPGSAQSEIDAMNRRRDAYQDRAAAAATRTDRNTADLAEFNRQVARYNLMLVYPDGIDEEARLTPKAADGLTVVR